MIQNYTFTDNTSITALEIGAGCGNFGKLYYPECYLTDVDISLRKSCNNCQIDWFCGYDKLPWGDDRFKNIIICNPFGYGFNDMDNTTSILDSLLRVLDFEGGKIIVLAHHTNKFCHPKRVKTRLVSYFEDKDLTYNFQVEEIRPEEEYVNYTFFSATGDVTKPNYRITINVTRRAK